MSPPPADQATLLQQIIDEWMPRMRSHSLLKVALWFARQGHYGEGGLPVGDAFRIASGIGTSRESAGRILSRAIEARLIVSRRGGDTLFYVLDTSWEPRQ